MGFAALKDKRGMLMIDNYSSAWHWYEKKEKQKTRVNYKFFIHFR